MPLSPRLLRWVTPLLLIAGVEVWLLIGGGFGGTRLQHLLLMMIAIIASVPPVARWIASQIDRIRNPPPRKRAITATCIAILACGYFAFNALYHKPLPILKFVDERSYAIGTQMAARGRLWMPEHPAADFFEGLNLIVHPTYASAYFPGTAIFYAPSIWLGIPWWLWSLLTVGACVGLIYRIVTELLDGVTGMLCSLIFISTPLVRVMSTMLLSQIPMLLMLLLMIWAWLRWRRSREQIRWLGIMGLLAGWASMIRPVDVLIAVIPLAVVMLLEIRPSWRRLPRLLLTAAACAMPFLVVQLISNRGVTGSWGSTPYALTVQQDHPQLGMGFGPVDPSIKPSSSLAQKLQHYAEFTLPAIQEHRLNNMLPGWFNRWLSDVALYAIPHPFLLVLIPVGVLSCRHSGLFVLGMLLLWVFFYALYPIPLVHYAYTATLGIALCIVAAADGLKRAWPPFDAGISTFLTLAILLLCITQLPQVNRTARGDWFDASELVWIDRTLNELPQKPAVVLFTYHPQVSSHVEPVYNTDVVWPDDAQVIRAHDLGERNIEIFNYYAKVQPGRVFYRYDRGNGLVTFLGLARDLGHAN